MLHTSVQVYALPKYERIAAILWELLPRLRGFSALQIIQFVYPSLIVKTLAMFTWRDCAARLVVERFLRKKAHTATDDELVDCVLRYILLLDYGSDLSQTKSQKCQHDIFNNLRIEKELGNLLWELIRAARANTENRC